MPDFPTGTVTLLFTDIEGSTRLLHELGDRYADALAEHRRVLREAFRRHGGVEVDTQGDAFFYAFARAKEAVAAAAEAQQALADRLVRVRIGIHTGEPIVTEEGYVGIDVHRAARIMSAGHGGQVLLSQPTRDLLESSVELRDLGEHRLKDLTEPQRLHQLGHADFPALKTLDATNLPVAASPLLGRDDELRELASLLSDGSRLVTVTGPGGTGKTRLALQAAAELVGAFSDGVFWVPLAGLSDPDLVPSSIARAIDARDALSEHLRAKELLILLDNAEHLLPAAPLLGELLAGSPRLRLLVTSRAPLRLSSEREYPLEPLGTSGSMALFLERARSAGRELEPSKTLEAICRRLDGLPLAIELAAARTKLLAPETLLQRLEHALPLLTGGARDAPKRQQTLRDTIEWSYELLDGEAKRLFARLAVFAGSFSLEAAEEVCAADLDELAALVDFNLLKPIGESRFLMLETIREYATERLEESGELEELRRAHSAYYAGLTNGLWAGLIRGETESWRLAEDELDNVHAALEFSLACASEHALALAGELWPFWTARGYVRQGRRWVERALALPGRGDSAARKWALMSLSQLAKVQGDLQTAMRATEDALRRFREINDQIRVSGILVELADFALAFGEVGRARALAEEALAVRRELGYAHGIARALQALGNVELAAGDLIRARTVLEDALERFREEAPDGVNTGGVLESLGEVARRSGADARAFSWFAEGLQFFARNRNEGAAAECLEGMACLATSGGDHERAARLAGAAEALYERSMTARGRPERPLPDRIEPAWSQGRSMTLDDAVEYALKGPRALTR